MIMFLLSASVSTRSTIKAHTDRLVPSTRSSRFGIDSRWGYSRYRRGWTLSNELSRRMRAQGRGFDPFAAPAGVRAATTVIAYHASLAGTAGHTPLGHSPCRRREGSSPTLPHNGETTTRPTSVRFAFRRLNVICGNWYNLLTIFSQIRFSRFARLSLII